MSEEKFTEEELPRGTVLLLGRALNGSELASLIRPEDDGNIQTILRQFRDYLEIHTSLPGEKRIGDR